MNRATLLDRRLRELHANRVELVRPIEELARIYRVMRLLRTAGSHLHDFDDTSLFTTIEEVEAYKYADTFSDFLKINRLPEYEVVLR